MLVRARHAALVIVAALAAGAACSDSDAPLDPPTVVPDIEPVPVTSSFDLSVDFAHPALTEAAHPTLEPSAEPVTISGGGGALAIRGFAKRIVHRPELVWLDLYVENLGDVALRDVVATIGGPTGLHDLTRDPFSGPASSKELVVGPLAAGGIGHLALGLPRAEAASLRIDARGVTTRRAPTSSTSLAITPDGAEAWIPFADANTVAVVDTATDARVASLEVPGAPSSVAVTPDGALVLVASPKANTVTIFDRASRRVVQTLGEADGIGREPQHVVVTPDGGRAFVSAYVGDTVTALVRNGSRYRFERKTAVGRRPTGLSVTADGSTLLVSHFLPRGPVTTNEAWITVLGTESLSVVKEVPIDDHFNIDRAKCIADVFKVSPERMTTEGVASQLAGVFMAPNGGEAWVPGTRVAGAALVWERGPKVDPELTSLAAIRPGELVPPFVFVFDARVGSDVERHLSQGGVERAVAPEYMSCARYQTEIEWVNRDLIPSAPGQQVNRFLAFPSGTSGLTESGIARAIGFTKGGRRALVLSHLADEIMLVDAATHHPASQRHFMLGGSNPIGIAVTPDGRKAYVNYENSTFASVLDLSAYADPKALSPLYVPYEYREVKDVSQVGVAFGSKLLVRRFADVPELPLLKETAKVSLVDADPMDPVLRRGRVLFDSSNSDKHPTLTASRLGACAGCHPGGGTDGSMWATMEGERRTMNLRGGLAGRGWLHSAATHSDPHEFVTIIVKERLGGNLSEEDLDAMAAYLSRGIPKLQHPVVDEALAERGREVFRKQCTGCHAGEKMTSGGDSAGEPTVFDVGTATDDARVALSPFFESLLPKKEAAVLRALRGDRALGPDDFVQQALDFRPRPKRARGAMKAPSLENVWDAPLLFHDGRFQKLEDAVRYLDEHLGLSTPPADQRAVVEFLKTL